MSEANVRRVLASDGARLRMLRLEALRDPAADIAFLETHDDAAARPREFWDDRAAGAALSGSMAQFVAEAGPSWIGTVTVLIPEAGVPDHFGRVRDDGTALVVAVYVSPSHRGRGVLDDLFARASTWALAQGCGELVLDVHEDNVRARAAYKRLGFARTGGTIDGQNGREVEMSCALEAPTRIRRVRLA